MYVKPDVKSQKSSFLGLIKYEAKQFCLNTGLHGYRFIVLPKRTLLERIIWVLVVLISFVSAITLLLIAWFEFRRNPIFLVTDSTHYPIWFYEFPSVIICNYNLMSKKKTLILAEEIVKSYKGTPESVAHDLQLMTRVFLNNGDSWDTNETKRLNEMLTSSSLTMEDALMNVAPTCEEMLLKCKWKGEEHRCKTIFEQVKTSMGFCCAFNYFAIKNHTSPYWAVGHKSNMKPRKVSACGYQTALEVLIESNPDDYYASLLPSAGHIILLNHPYDFPDWSSTVILNGMKINNLISVTPTITQSTDNVKALPIAERRCLFPNERELLNFQQYSYHNCMIECKMNITFTLCGCVPFYYYNANGTYPPKTLCGVDNWGCLQENKYMIFSSMPGSKYQSTLTDYTMLHPTVCDCWPDCEVSEYTAESSSARLSRKYSTNQKNLYGDYVIRNQSVVRVYFNDLVSVRNRRDVVYTWYTLLAYYGGLLGLFVGFSFVSAIELIYFFTVRLLSDYFQRGKKVVQDTEYNQKKIHVKPIHVKPNQLNIRFAHNPYPMYGN